MLKVFLGLNRPKPPFRILESANRSLSRDINGTLFVLLS